MWSLESRTLRILPACGALLLARPQELSAQEANRSPAWLFTLQFQEAWYTNVRFGTAPQSDSVSQLGGGLTRRWSGRRTGIEVSGAGAAIFFRRLPQLNRLTYNAGISGDAAISRRGTLAWTGTSSKSYLFDSLALAEAGLPLPLVAPRRDQGTVNLRLPVGQRTTFVTDLGHRRVTFQSPQLADATISGAGAGLARTLGRSDSLTGSLRYSRNRSRGRAGEIYTAQAGWGRVLTRRLTGSVSAGVSHFRTVGGSANGNTFSGGAQIGGQFRNAQFDAGVSRSVNHAEGLGRDRISDVFSINGTRPLTRKLSSQGRVRYALSRDPEGSFRFTGTDGSVALAYSLPHSLALTGAFGLRRIDFSPARRIESERWSLSLSYGRSWP